MTTGPPHENVRQESVPERFSTTHGTKQRRARPAIRRGPAVTSVARGCTAHGEVPDRVPDYAGGMSLMTVSGVLSVREKIAFPPGGVATVKVVDEQGEVLAATALPVDGVPVEFTLDIDDELVTSELFVWAFLRHEAGGWGTLELVPADLGTVDLTRIGD